METKLFARIGAIVFVAIAITMTALQLREEPVRAVPEVVDVSDPDSDPLPEQLRQCNAMGEAAARVPICHAAWAEKRQRFFGKAVKVAPEPGSPLANAIPPMPVATAAGPSGDQ